MIVIAGRQAKPVCRCGRLSEGSALLGFAMFNASPAEQAVAADINKWVAEGKLRPVVGQMFPLDRGLSGGGFLEANTLHGAGILKKEVVLTIE